MTILTAQYLLNPDGENYMVKITKEGWDKPIFVPMDLQNSDYAEIMRQVEAADLTIADAE